MHSSVLVINPGSTSTKIAVFDGEALVFEETLRHPTSKLETFENILDQYDFRKEAVLEALTSHDIKLDSLRAIVGRGGLIGPIEGGTYQLDDRLIEALKKGAIEKGHASNLAGLIAKELADSQGIPAFIVDPPCVDEMKEIARITGLAGTKRISLFHALNQKAVARRAAKDIGKAYEACNLIVAHVGGGISVGAHEKGRVIDVNNALDGDGPFSPERAGEVPTGEIVKLCFSGNYSQKEIKKMLVGKGGLVSYLGVNDVRIVQDKIAEGDEEAALIYDAMIYQVAKAIGSMATVLKGDYDAIILTGGIAYSEIFSQKLMERVGFLGKYMVYPGEDELIALAEGALRVLNGEEQGKRFQG